MAIFAVASVRAQSGTKRIAQLKAEITTASKELVKHRSDPVLREKRGDLYVSLYREVFANDSGGDRDRIDLISKAVTDYTHVVWANHGPAEIFLKRGTAYALRWRLATAHWAEEARGNRDPAWNDIVDWEDRARQRAVFKKFVTNSDFDLAAADLDRASKDASDPAVEILADFTLGRLHLERTRVIPYRTSDFARELGEKGVAGFSVWDDFEPAVRNIFDGQFPSRRPEKALQLVLLPTGFAESTANDVLYQKILLAVAYGRDAEAVAIRNYYSTWVGTTPLGNKFSCEYYTTVYEAQVRLGQYDSVIGNFGRVQESEPLLECGAAHEPRGDAYFAKGLYENAVEDYTTAAGSGLVAVSPKIYLKRSKAYLKLGQKEKALADADLFLESSGGTASPEDHLYRASILREMGNTERTAKDENTARELALSNKINDENAKRSGKVYGTLLLPYATSESDIRSAVVTLNYADGTSETASLDQLQRFVFRHVKQWPFYITAQVGGRQVRTRRFVATRTHVGPLRVSVSAPRK